LTTTQ